MNFHEAQSLEQHEANIYNGLKSLVQMCHGASYFAGWWRDPVTGQNLRNEVRDNTRFGKALVAEKLALIHSEVSEAMEGARKGLMDDKLPQFTMIITELADAMIRIADLIGALDLDKIEEVLPAKLAFNAVRPDHKPENRIAEGGKAY